MQQRRDIAEAPQKRLAPPSSQASPAAEHCSAPSPFPCPSPHTACRRVTTTPIGSHSVGTNPSGSTIPFATAPFVSFLRIDHRHRVGSHVRHIQPAPIRAHRQRLRLRPIEALPRQPRIEVPLQRKPSLAQIQRRHRIPIPQRHIQRLPIRRHRQRIGMRPRRTRSPAFSSGSFRPTVPFTRSSSTTSLAFQSPTNARRPSFASATAIGYILGTTSLSLRSNRVTTAPRLHPSAAHHPTDYPPPATFRHLIRCFLSPAARAPPQSPPDTAPPAPHPPSTSFVVLPAASFCIGIFITRSGAIFPSANE